MILPEFFEACDECGEPFERNTTYPVLTSDDDRSMKLHSFCDDECLSAWREGGSPEEREDGHGEAEA